MESAYLDAAETEGYLDGRVEPLAGAELLGLEERDGRRILFNPTSRPASTDRVGERAGRTVTWAGRKPRNVGEAVADGEELSVPPCGLALVE